MARVYFSVSYTIEAERLPEYHELVRRLRQINEEREIEYMVFGGKNNTFTEVSIFPSQEAFDEADDLGEDTKANDYIGKIIAMAQNTQYSTMYEVEIE